MKKSKLTTFYGPMFSGKSALLINHIMNNTEVSKLVFKPIGDLRSKKIFSREGTMEIDAISIEEPNQIIGNIKSWTDTIYIDEFHFFGQGLVETIREVLSKGIDVIISGLDTDFRGEEFKVATEIIEISDKATKLMAKCSLCGQKSSLTARFINGEPDSKDSPIILSDNSVKEVEYKTLCKSCHPYFGE